MMDTDPIDTGTKHPNGSDSKPKRILTIDGGGIKGVFPASFLATIEKATGKSVVDHFDLIVGTSTGGIIALGLGLGWRSRDLLDFYQDYGPQIFKRPSFFQGLLSLFRSKYDPTPLHQALEEEFGERRIGESRARLVVPSLNLETGEVHLYKTSHHPRFECDYKKKAIEAARATSAAPAYFPSFLSNSGVPLVDGGIWANNPMNVAVVEGLTTLGWPAESIHILSLGCTREPYDGESARNIPKGFGYWALNATELFMTAQSSSSKGMSKLLLGGTDRILRVNPTVTRGRFDLDKVKGISALRGLGETEARNALPKIRRQFLGNPTEPFKPYHEL